MSNAARSAGSMREGVHCLNNPYRDRHPVKQDLDLSASSAREGADGIGLTCSQKEDGIFQKNKWIEIRGKDDFLQERG